jgi:hypothetical protein
MAPYPTPHHDKDFSAKIMPDQDVSRVDRGVLTFLKIPLEGSFPDSIFFAGRVAKECLHPVINARKEDSQ